MTTPSPAPAAETRPAVATDPRADSTGRAVARHTLGAALAFFGAGHVSFLRKPFAAQVPEKLEKPLPFDADDIVLGSGVAELGLGAALIGLPKERRRIGFACAAYFVAIFPGNISQLLKHDDSLGLDSDRKRAVRLVFQPLLVLWSLYAGEII